MEATVQTGIQAALLILGIAALTSCNNTCNKPTQQPEPVSTALTIADTTSKLTLAPVDSANDDYATYYISIADTGQKYALLMTQMYRIGKELHWAVDTMHRHYDPTKNKIVLAEDDKDELYRGDYYPRRSTSTFLSLEYYFVYSKNSSNNNIALIAGIFNAPGSADSMTSLLKVHAPNAFSLKASVFVGCMH